MTYFDRSDICEAHYLYLAEYHEGQWSPAYAKLSALLAWYSPRPSLRDADDLEDNARAIYDNLVAGEVTP